MTLDNQVLLERLRHPKTSAEAFDSIYTKYYKLICMQVYNYLEDLQPVEDIAQSVFASFWSQAPWKKEDIHSIPAYLIQMSKYQCERYLRKENKKLPRITDVPISENPQDARDEMNHILQAVSLLPPQRKRVFQLVYLQDYDQKEAAQIMGISYRMVSMHLKWAKEQIRNTLKKFE